MRDYKDEYRRWQSGKKEKLKRADRNRWRKKLGLKKGDPRDASHTKNGVVAKHYSKNRGSKSDQPGDVRARGGNKYKRLKKN
jgi:hypothetical protein